MSYSTSSDQSQMMASDSKAAQAPGATVPDLVRIGQIPTNTAIDIETDILDPVVHSDTFCRFQFQNKGILHSNSKIVLRLNTNSGTDKVGFLPVGVGIHSLIERCSLRVGTKTISEIDDFNHYIGYKSMFLSNEQQKQRELFISGRRLAHKPYYNEGGTDWSGSDNLLQTEAKFLGLDNGAAVDCERDEATATVANCRNFCEVNDKFGPEFAVSIQDLFPFLYQNQLPLFMMKEPVTIELFFSKAVGERCCMNTVNSGSNDTAFTIDQSATELVADYQYFPQEMMEQYAQQNADLSFTFMDYRLAKRSIAVSASGSEASTGQLIMNVGGAGRLVTKVITGVSDDSDKTNSMLQNYHARGMKRIYSGDEAARRNGELTTNIKYNDHFLYPVDVTNSAQQFHNLVQAEGMVPFIAREEYNFEGQGITPGTYEGHPQNNQHQGLVNNFFYQAYKLNRNERINSRGLELYNTYDMFANRTDSPNTMTQRSYLELIRVAQLRDGIMDVFFA